MIDRQDGCDELHILQFPLSCEREACRPTGKQSNPRMAVLGCLIVVLSILASIGVFALLCLYWLYVHIWS